MNHITKQIARQRIQTLFRQATHIYKVNPELAQSYLWTSRKIAMATRVRLPQYYKRQVCKKCNALLIPGESSRTRTKPRREPHLVITCLRCGFQTRIPLNARNRMKQKNE